MKLKRSPYDFVVQEMVKLDVKRKGRYSLYLVKKFGANTMDVIRDMARRMRISPSSISYGGLKDRYAVSSQYVTVDGDFRWNIKARNYEAIYLGKVDEPMERGKIEGNRFTIKLKGFPKDREEDLQREIELVKEFGFVNYYGDQRFGSARHGKGFFAKKLIERDYEGALRLLFTPSRKDGSKLRRLKRCVLENWGNWERCVSMAEGEEKKILLFLSGKKMTKGNFKKAIELMNHETLLLFLHAYQSFIWNETSKGVVERFFDDRFYVSYSAGEMAFFRSSKGVPEEVLALEIPFPGPKLKPEGIWGEIMLEVLKREGIGGLENFKTHVKGGLFETHRRKFIVFPRNLSYRLLNGDVELSFELPSGSYATTLLKRVFGAIDGVDF